MYELSNHPGNVLTTVSDIKLTADGDADGVVDSYAAVITSAQDYYPFGSLEPDRTFSSDNYRFGFNGQEMDNEISGQTGTHTTAMFWEYDSRLGRRWNLDPKPQVSMSDYACFANNPIWFTDPLGDKVGYGKTEYRSKAGVYMRVLWNRIIDRQFRQDHRQMRRDKEDKFIYQEVDPNAISTAAINSRSIITNSDPYDNSNPFMKSNNGWAQDDDIQDKIYLNYRTRNKESLHSWGAGKNIFGEFITGKEQHKNSKHSYSAGTITIRGTSNADAGPYNWNDTGPDNLIIRQGGVIIFNQPMPTTVFGRGLKISLPFIAILAGGISIEISNPNYPNNTPGAFNAHIRIRSL